MIGTLVSATAHDINTVIGGGCIIGVASGMRQIAWSSLGEIVTKRDRGLAFSFLQIILGVAGGFGPIIGESFYI